MKYELKEGFVFYVQKLDRLGKRVSENQNKEKGNVNH